MTARHLNSGHSMPSLALGTFQGAYSYEANTDVTKAAVYEALKAGYRHVDTAYLYNTEEGVGQGIAKALADNLLTRQEVFVTTKLWATHHKRPLVLEQVKRSLSRLKLEYIDLYLMHWPTSLPVLSGDVLIPKDDNGDCMFDDDTDYLEAWLGMEDCVRAGLVRSIGASNLCIKQLKRLLANCKIQPAVLQMESHPFYSDEETVKFCQERGIVFQSYSPLAKGYSKPGGVKDDDPCVFTNPIIGAIASKHSVSVAQVALRWQIDRGCAVVAKSKTQARIEENIKIFEGSFKLDEKDMAEMRSLNKNYKVVIIPWLRPSKYYPFKDDCV